MQIEHEKFETCKLFLGNLRFVPWIVGLPEREPGAGVLAFFFALFRWFRVLTEKLRRFFLPYRRLLQHNNVHQTEFENLLQKLCIDLSKGFHSRAQSQLSNNAALTVRKIYFFSEIIKQQLPWDGQSFFCHHRNLNCAGCHGSASTSFSTILSR